MQLPKGKQHSSLYSTNAEKGNPPFRSYLEPVEPDSLGRNYSLISLPVINTVVVINIQRGHQSNKAAFISWLVFLFEGPRVVNKGRSCTDSSGLITQD